MQEDSAALQGIETGREEGEGAPGRFQMQILELQLSSAHRAPVWKLTFSLFS